LEVVLPKTEVSLTSDRSDQASFDFGVIDKGYGWVFPKDDHWSAGLYVLADRVIGARKVLLDYLREKGFQSNRSLLAGVRAHCYPVGGQFVRVPDCPIYLTGDAGGLAEAITGEGIYYALESGRLAGRHACSFHFGRSSPQDYYRELRSSVLADTYLSYQAAKWFYRNPRRCLRIFESSRAWRPIARGYSEGKTLSQSLLSILPSFIRSIRETKFSRR